MDSAPEMEPASMGENTAFASIMDSQGEEVSFRGSYQGAPLLLRFQTDMVNVLPLNLLMGSWPGTVHTGRRCQHAT